MSPKICVLLPCHNSQVRGILGDEIVASTVGLRRIHIRIRPEPKILYPVHPYPAVSAHNAPQSR